MSRRIVSAGLVACAALALLAGARCATTSPATSRAPSGTPAPVEGKTVLLPVASDPTITIKVQLRAGSSNDPAGKEGLAELTARMIAEAGAGALRYDQILDALYPMSAGYGASVDKEVTVVTGRVHRDHLPRFTALFVDALTRPRFAEDDFRRLRDEQLNAVEKTLRFSSDEELGKAALQALVFEGTSYRHPVLGTVAGLRAITLDDVRAFHRTHYRRANAIIGIGGGYPADYPAALETALGALPAGPAPPRLPPPAPALPPGISVVLIDKPNADASISMGRPIAVRRGERAFYAAALANSWLGEHRHSASRLFQIIRELRGLNYGDYSYIEAFPRGGLYQIPPTGVARRAQLFEVWIRTLPNDKALFATKAALRQIDGLLEGGLPQKDLELTREFLSKYTLHFATTTEARLGHALDDAFFGIDGEGHLARYRTTLAKLSGDEVHAAIRAVMTPEPFAIAIVTGDAAGLERSLVAGEPTPITYDTPKPDTILREDEAIAAYPLRVPKERIRIVPVTEVFER